VCSKLQETFQKFQVPNWAENFEAISCVVFDILESNGCDYDLLRAVKWLELGVIEVFLNARA
jgi:hypothetical protein